MYVANYCCTDIILYHRHYRTDILFVTGENLKFTPGPSLVSDEIHLEWNYPSGDMTKLEWYCHYGDPLDPNRYIIKSVTKAGKFVYTWKLPSTFLLLVIMTYCAIFSTLLSFSIPRIGVILVDCDVVFPLSGICCITHITKLLGSLTEWEGRLRVSHEVAYNMIHFTPIQQLGSSQSAYNISDHLALCDRYLPADYKPQNVSVTYTGMS